MGLTRSDLILKYIVEFFIKKAEPIGSKTLIEEYDLPYSSATIRNEMLLLERMGYIEKTHTSSGRVPSSKGYKYYCDHLRGNNISDELKYSIQQVLNEKSRSVEETIKESCEIISHMTSLVSVVLGPDESKERLASVQMIKVSDTIMTAIFVTDTGFVENKTFKIQNELAGDDIVKCVALLNDRLKGTAICDLKEKMESLRPVLSEYIVDHDVVYQALLQTFLKFANDRMALYGREELFTHREFTSDMEKLQKVFQLIHNTSLLKDLNENSETDLSVNIGELEDNPEVTILTTKIKTGEKSDSTIALIGPRRMDYDKAMSALEYLSDALNEYFDDKGGNDDE